MFYPESSDTSLSQFPPQPLATTFLVCFYEFDFGVFFYYWYLCHHFITVMCARLTQDNVDFNSSVVIWILFVLPLILCNKIGILNWQWFPRLMVLGHHLTFTASFPVWWKSKAPMRKLRKVSKVQPHGYSHGLSSKLCVKNSISQILAEAEEFPVLFLCKMS